MRVVIKSEQWRAYNQSIRDNLQDDDEEEYMMNQLVCMNHIDSSDDEHVQRGGSRLGRKPNKDRRTLFHAELLYINYFSETPFFDVGSFRNVYRMHKCLFLGSHNSVCESDDYFE